MTLKTRKRRFIFVELLAGLFVFGAVITQVAKYCQSCMNDASWWRSAAKAQEISALLANHQFVNNNQRIDFSESNWKRAISENYTERDLRDAWGHEYFCLPETHVDAQKFLQAVNHVKVNGHVILSQGMLDYLRKTGALSSAPTA